jgi:hypothetical protein
MPDETEKSVSLLQTKHHDRYSAVKQSQFTDSYGRYRYTIPAQDQIIAILDGMKISGTYERIQGDSQSEWASPRRLAAKVSETVEQLSQRLADALAYYVPKSGYISDIEAPIHDTANIGLLEEQETDTAVDAVSQWPPDGLASAIMQPDAEADMPRLREMILVAEDTRFSVAQSEQLSAWLLSFAQKHRHSEDPKDEAPVWSALRTGASMLRPNNVNCLGPLLEPGHSIETSLVTLKMIGRIFEAQPPAELDGYQHIAKEVCLIAQSLLNPHVITASQSAAKAQLAIYALVAMASSETASIIKSVQELGVTWFTRRTLRKLRKLNQIWASCSPTIEKAPRELLETALQMLESD